MNMRVIHITAVSVIIASLVSLASCQQFFTSSLAKPLARDSYTIPSNISVGSAVELLAGGDARIAAALVAPLYAAASTAAPGSIAYNEAASALVTAVVLSSDASPAIFSVVEDLGTSGFDTLTQEQIDSALANLLAISLTPGETAALLLIADDADAPTGLPPDQLYVAAFALAVDAFNDASMTQVDLDDWLNGGALPAAVDGATINASTNLLALAQAADSASGITSIFGQLLSGLSFN